MAASIFALDHLTPKGDKKLEEKIKKVYAEIRMTYKKEARMFEAFISRLREEQRFDSADALMDQLRRDREDARASLVNP